MFEEYPANEIHNQCSNMLFVKDFCVNFIILYTDLNVYVSVGRIRSSGSQLGEIFEIP
jgi:hypothetical protein